MARWQLSLDLDAQSSEPIFVRIARAVAADLQRGRLRPGQRLPGTRSLADALGVHRNTVVAAYEELEAEGWIETRPARGTFVVGQLGALPRRAGGRARAALRTQFPIGPKPDIELRVPSVARYDLCGGIPDVRLVPRALLARAYRRVLNRSPALLDYGDPRGQPALRSELARMLRERRGLSCDAGDLLVTRGSQMALYLVARALFAPGDRVLVESFGYRPAWDAFRAAGAELTPVGVDRRGLRVVDVERQLASGPVRALYLTSHHQYPTTALLAPARRLKLLELARRERFAIIEDDYDNEFHYDARPLLPIAHADRHGSVVYLGTLSKVLAPGLRLGFVAAPQNLLERLMLRRSAIDRQGDAVSEAAVAELLEEGEIERHFWRTRRVYHARRDALAQALRRSLGSVLEFEVPKGGLALWARVAADVHVPAWVAAASQLGVAIGDGARYAFRPGYQPFVRLGFARHDKQELNDAVQLLARALTRVRGVTATCQS